MTPSSFPANLRGIYPQRGFWVPCVHPIRSAKEVDNKVYICEISNTVMCLSIGTPKKNKFSICSKWKIYNFRCPKIWAHFSLIKMGLNIGTPNYHHFPVGTNEKVVVLGVPIFKHFRVIFCSSSFILRIQRKEGS